MACQRVEALEKKFIDAWPTHLWCDSHVVLAVSAGPDSVAMLRAAVAIKKGGGGRLFVAHLNHALRGAEADADQAWLETLCRRLNAPLESGRTDVAEIAENEGDGWEAAARTARYDFLRGVAERLGARFVAVAHTADDQVETVLHRIVRGTGLAGLAGIPRVRPLAPSVTLVRPLLDVPRHEVLEYLAAIGQDYRTDVSNTDLRWTRNRLRNELLPLLRERYNTDVDSALRRLAAQAIESQQVIADLAAGLAREFVAVESGDQAVAHDCRAANCVQIDRGPLLGQPLPVIREVCKFAWSDANWPQQAMGFDQWQQLAEMLRGEGNRPPINLPGNVRARRDKDLLILERPGLP